MTWVTEDQLSSASDKPPVRRLQGARADDQPDSSSDSLPAIPLTGGQLPFTWLYHLQHSESCCRGDYLGCAGGPTEKQKGLAQQLLGSKHETGHTGPVF